MNRDDEHAIDVSATYQNVPFEIKQVSWFELSINSSIEGLLSSQKFTDCSLFSRTCCFIHKYKVNTAVKTDSC